MLNLNTSHRRSIIAYIFLVGLVALAFVGYQTHINHHFEKDSLRFEEADRVSCAVRTLILRNQVVVLRFHLATSPDLDQIDQVTGKSWRVLFEESLRATKHSKIPLC